MWRNARPFVAENVEPEMKAVSPEAGFTWENVPGCAALNTADDDDVTELAKNLSQKNHSLKVGFGTEAGHFQEAGMPTIVCGPGSIDQAHKPDEFLSLEQVKRCEDFMWRLVDKVSVIGRSDGGRRYLDPRRRYLASQEGRAGLKVAVYRQVGEERVPICRKGPQGRSHRRSRCGRSLRPPEPLPPAPDALDGKGGGSVDPDRDPAVVAMKLSVDLEVMADY